LEDEGVVTTRNDTGNTLAIKPFSPLANIPGLFEAVTVADALGLYTDQECLQMFSFPVIDFDVEQVLGPN